MNRSLYTLLFLLGAAASAAAQTPATIDFARDVRPILANHCWTCHGFDESSREADLRLDLRDAATSPLKTGKRAIVPGNPGESAIIDRINHAKPSRRMPPAEFKRPLTDAQRAILARWVAEGAEYRNHWAFIPPARPEPPEVKNAGWPINPIDRFILARLEREGMKPSPPASRQTLLRRAALDLTGLPPTPEELDAFLNDRSPAAYEKAVDRLLESPRYAEKMAAPWLDLARYADTNGYNNDDERTMWPWRDWVLRAFAGNMPYDRFLVEQLAGDLVPDATPEQKLATGFNRNHGFTTEGGIIVEEYRVEYVADRVHTTSTAVLGLSFQCARCHEHKYDPISQKEYYEFFAFFNNIEDRFVGPGQKIPSAPSMKYVAPETRARLADIDGRHAATLKQVARYETDHADAPRRWEEQLTPDERTKIASDGAFFHLRLDEGKGRDIADTRASTKGVIAGTPGWTDGKFGKALDLGGEQWIDLGGSGGVVGDEPFSFSLWVHPKASAGGILSKMDVANNHRGYDLLISANGVLECHLVHQWPGDAIKVMTKGSLVPGAWHHVALTYDGSRKAAGVKFFLDGKPAETSVVADRLKGTLETPFAFQVGRRGTQMPFHGKIDDVQFFRRELKSTDVAALFAGRAATPIADLLGRPREGRTTDENALIARHYFDHVDTGSQRLRQLAAGLAEEKLKLEKLSIPVMVMQELPKRRDTFILKRGQYDQRADKVEPGVPAFLPPIPMGTRTDRLALARWLVDPSHPLTARVAVNRWWESYFGAGIVETVEDFGLQGEFPSHPELLDWLATELIRTGWDVKAMQKLIVTSATYRQSSHVTAELLARDPKNRLLARSPRYRLPAETVRDNALAISGLLKEKFGGPSVKPYQPAGLWEEIAVNRSHRYVRDKGDNLYRRGLYTFWRRTIAPPGMATFDAPNREYCVPRRARTNTPLQALILLNDPTFVEAARVLAERMMKADASPEARLSYAFRRAVSREPSAEERRILLSLLDDSLTRFKKDPAAATKLLSTGDWPRDNTLDAAELAAWTSVASTILNLDETISRP